MLSHSARGSFARGPLTLLTLAIVALVLGACGAQRAVTPPAADVSPVAAPTLPPAPEARPTEGQAGVPTSAPTAEPVAQPQASQRPPAPLVYNQRGQLYRLAPDGTTTQLTDEAAPEPGGVAITEFDVSPVDGSLVYVVQQITAENQSVQALIQANADGTGRTALLEGAFATSPRFSPNGEQIAFGVYPDLFNPNPAMAGGVYTILAAGGEPRLIQPNDPFDPASSDGSARAYAPISWSPDGARLLLQAFLPASEFCETAIALRASFANKEPGGDEVITPVAPEDTVTSCRQATWSADGQTVYISLYEPGMFGVFAGLAQVDAATGTLTTLLGNQVSDSSIVINPGLLPRADGTLLGFVATSPTPFLSEPGQPQPSFTLHAIGPDGQLTPLREDSHVVWSAALWAEDGSGAVIQAGEGVAPEHSFVWVPAGDLPAVELAAGELMGAPRWGR